MMKKLVVLTFSVALLQANAGRWKPIIHTFPIRETNNARRGLQAKSWRLVATRRECTDSRSGTGEYWWWQGRQQWLHDSTYDEPRSQTPTWAQCQQACNITPWCNVVSRGRGRHGGMCVWEQNCNVHSDLRAHSNYDVWVADNTCTCENGSAAAGSTCSTHRAHMCTSCSASFHMVNHRCRSNRCSCRAGTAATDSACTSNNAHICSSCTSGYSLSSGHQCRRLNSCNGRSHGSTWAVTCTAGQRGSRTYRCNDGTTTRTSDSCQVNVCSCNNGTPASTCSSHRERRCATCNRGFSLTHGATSCTANRCTCRHGSPRTGTACTSNSAMCQSCVTGFRLNGVHCESCAVPQAAAYRNAGAACVPSRCLNGYRPQGSSCRRCTVPGATLYGDRCAATACRRGWTVQGNVCVCAAGYHNLGGNCVVNECRCANGQPRSDRQCTRHGGNMCRSCNAGYHSSGVSCQANECLCANGIPLNGNACTRPGATGMCASCTAGFRLNGRVCEAIQRAGARVLIQPRPIPPPVPRPDPKPDLDMWQLLASTWVIVIVVVVLCFCLCCCGVLHYLWTKSWNQIDQLSEQNLKLQEQMDRNRSRRRSDDVENTIRPMAGASRSRARMDDFDVVEMGNGDHRVD